jgi:hypothetical protein
MRNSYKNGQLLGQWAEKYPSSLLFRTRPVHSRQLPPLGNFGFGEFFVGIYYLEQGFEVLRCFERKNKYPEVFAKAQQLLGPEASRLILRHRAQKPITRPPDLLVIEPNRRFFFSEVKLPGDELNAGQKDFFIEIEKLMNECMPSSHKSITLPSGDWIEVVRLRPGLEPAT